VLRRAISLTIAAAALAATPALAQDPPPQGAPPPAEPPRVAAGVTVGGIDLSGATLEEATARLQAELAPRLNRTVALRAAGRRFALTPTQAKLVFDAEGSARRALKATAPGPVAPKLGHSRLAVRAWLAAAAKTVYHAPRDARVRITLRHLRVSHSQPGKRLPEKALAKQVDTALDDALVAQRFFRAALVPVQAKTRIKDLRRRYATVITIDKAHFRLRLFKNLRISKRYSVAVGQPAYPTPSGLFSIVNKQVNPVWSVPNSPWAGELQGTTVEGGSAANPLKARWMGIVNGVGIHGTGEDYSIGTRASHGCIRMHVSDVIDLYPRVPVGTAVLIK
jgi:lipoprotein-anchoring transpeptidase ErfK/SrfK